MTIKHLLQGLTKLAFSARLLFFLDAELQRVVFTLLDSESCETTSQFPGLFVEPDSGVIFYRQ